MAPPLGSNDVCSHALSHGRVQNAFPQARGFRRGLDEFIGIAVLNRAPETHPQRDFPKVILVRS